MGQFSEFWDAIFDTVNDVGGEEEAAFVVVSKEFMEVVQAEGGLDFDGTITVENINGPIWEITLAEEHEAG